MRFVVSVVAAATIVVVGKREKVTRQLRRVARELFGRKKAKLVR
jgi:hypothetical protein